MNQTAPPRWALPDAISDPNWKRRPQPRRQHRHAVAIIAGIVVAACGLLITAILLAPSSNHQSAAPTQRTSSASQTATATANTHPAPTPDRSPVNSTGHPSTRLRATGGRASSVAVATVTIGGATTAQQSIATRTVTHSAAPSTPAAQPPSTPQPGPTQPTQRPVPVTTTATQSISCDPDTTLTATGSADSSGTLNLTGGGSSQTRTGSYARITLSLGPATTFTASMTGINPHVSVSCQ
jgi:hypothetical protein